VLDMLALHERTEEVARLLPVLAVFGDKPSRSTLAITGWRWLSRPAPSWMMTGTRL
jgi:hypothetical protein